MKMQRTGIAGNIFMILYKFNGTYSTMEFLSKLKRYDPYSQLKLLFLEGKDRICINICKRRRILQISFILFLSFLFIFFLYKICYHIE